MAETDGGPAFPYQPLGRDGLPEWEGAPGMSLRDHIEVQAMASLIKTIPFEQTPGFSGYAAKGSPYWDRARNDWSADIAKEASRLAAAMLAEREKRNG